MPGENGTAALVALAGSGVRIRILTNSLAASDEKSVHAGYAKRREDLLRAGIRLYELKPTAADEMPKAKKGDSSSAGLHAKTFAVDRPRLRRLVQLRPALRLAEHRDGARDRQS